MWHKLEDLGNKTILAVPLLAVKAIIMNSLLSIFSLQVTVTTPWHRCDGLVLDYFNLKDYRDSRADPQAVPPAAAARRSRGLGLS